MDRHETDDDYDSSDESDSSYTSDGPYRDDASHVGEDIPSEGEQSFLPQTRHRITPSEFLTCTAAPAFSASQALGMLQESYCMNYGRQQYGSKPTSETDDYFPRFYLDMWSLVGLPLRSVVLEGSSFDNVTFTLQYWQASYSSKHANSSLSFELTGRTFRLATGSAREVWFVVMHPVEAEMTELPGSHRTGNGRHRQADTGERSAMRKDHAEALAIYIKQIFQEGALLGEGVEPSWTLGDGRSQNMTLQKWSLFQMLFMEKWSTFAETHGYDDYWAEHQPAFHAYDHGANVDIPIPSGMANVSREVPIHPDEDASYSGSSRQEREREDISQREITDDESDSRMPERMDSEGAASESGRATDQELYQDGLEELRGDLERRYNLDHIAQISYAIAANIYCSENSPQSDGTTPAEAKPLCLLADRRQVTAAYEGIPFTFYPLAFHPRFGNFVAKRPPQFLNNLYTTMCSNMKVQNDGHEVLHFGGFQGYCSGLKRAIRHRKEDLLATQGCATAALTLSPSEASRGPARLRAKHERLLGVIRGQQTPEQPQASTPFARESQRINTIIEEKEVAFRMEQVVTVRTSGLIPERRNFFTVLRPIFQYMRFFLSERDQYRTILRAFPLSLFPGILCGFARLFELSFEGMEKRYRASGDNGLDLALCESIACLDRLGNYCFTGDPRVLPRTVLGPLRTMESLKYGWPYVSPEMLDFQTETGRMNMIRWPTSGVEQKRLILMHVAALNYHYGPHVAADRQSQIWFGQVGCKGIRHVSAALEFLEDVFRELWIPQMVVFMVTQLRRQLNRGVQGGMTLAERSHEAKEASTLLKSWEADKEPFSMEQHNKLFENGPSRVLSNVRRNNKSAHDFARDLYASCRGTSKADGQAFTTKKSTWHVIICNAIRLTKKKDVSRDDWIDGLACAISSAGIQWVPGQYKGRLTSMEVLELVGPPKNRKILTAPRDSLKRKAAEAEEQWSRENQQPRDPRRQIIHFGCAYPFTAVPKLILDGFAAHQKVHRLKTPRVANHYEAALSCLLRWVGQDGCNLMLMLVLTLAASSKTPKFDFEKRQFEAAPMERNREQFAATLVMRMLWFVFPSDFSEIEGVNGRVSIKEMMKKTGYYYTNNWMLVGLDWVSATTGRPNLPNSDCIMFSVEQLKSRRETLEGLRQSDPNGFIAEVFRSHEPVWVERCASIIVDEPSRS
ncbi:hypothetical protein E4U13_006377 [Claviceps humidiphila]|uniref:Uncharacterized protein n=1 Tax=Claviceps humidiphila TaxID=1294629 RepID=A0A9P7PV79_9HYPO|nr:hypothetical protein E4U13_006377 [Claviceps humidiphila]